MGLSELGEQLSNQSQVEVYNEMLLRVSTSALQGLLANPENHNADFERLAKEAIAYAIALASELEKELR